MSFSAGMGVEYLTASDIVDQINRVNSTLGVRERVSEFNAGVEFFGKVGVPLSKNWEIMIEYAYLFTSYSVTNIYGNGDFSFLAHMPSAVLQYILIEEGVYNVKGGIGVGYHVGCYSEQYFTVTRTYSGTGFGTLADLEANTAFGESLYGYLGLELRWEFIGNLTDDNGNAPNRQGIPTNLHFFGVGARFGFTYYF